MLQKLIIFTLQLFSNSGDLLFFREVKISEVVRTNSDHCLTNTWTTTLPAQSTLGNPCWLKTGRIFGQSIQAIQEPMEIAHTSHTEKENSERISSKKKFPRMPTIELNGIPYSPTPKSRDTRPLIKAATFGMIQSSTDGTDNFPKPMIKSRSVSPNNSSKRVATVKIEKDESYQGIKKKIRSLIGTEETLETNIAATTTMTNSCMPSKFIFFVLLAISVGLLGIFLMYEEKSAGLEMFGSSLRKDVVANISIELRERVYGQESALDELLKDLSKGLGSSNHLIALVGGTGVGKSLTVSIVRKHLTHANWLVFEYFAPLHKTIHEAFESFSRRQCNFVILENLKQADLNDVIKFFKFLKENRMRDFCVYIMAVINPQEIDKHFARTLDLKRAIEDIVEAFRVKSIGSNDAKIIPFENLNDSVIETCVRRIALDHHLELNESGVSDILEGLRAMNAGCKGAYAKLQLQRGN